MAIEKRGNAQFSDVQHLVAGKRGRQVFVNGDIDYGVWTAGQVIGLIDDIPTCKVLLERMVSEAEEILKEKMRLISSKL